MSNKLNLDKPTHIIEFSKSDNGYKEGGEQPAFGKTDLIDCLRNMMREGYTDFKITTIKP
jgi:hypothetical protein